MPKHKAPLEKKGKNAWTEHKTQPTTGRTNDGVNRLHVRAVDDGTNKYYIEAVADFLRCVKKEASPFRTIEERDVVLADYMCDLCYSQNLPPSKGVLVFSGFHHIFPDCDLVFGGPPHNIGHSRPAAGKPDAGHCSKTKRFDVSQPLEPCLKPQCPRSGFRHVKVDIASGRRDLEEVRRRGRWASLGFVQRYTKDFLLIQHDSEVPDVVRCRRLEFEKNPAVVVRSAIMASPAVGSQVAEVCISDHGGASEKVVLPDPPPSEEHVDL